MPEWLTADLVDSLVAGAVLTVVLALVTGALAFGVAVAVAGVRVTGSRLTRRLAGAYVEIFRNVPALIQIIFWAFAVPSLVPADARRTVFFDNALWDVMGDVTGLSLPYYAVAASIGLVLNTSAHLAELVRAGAGSVPAARVEVARSLGASRWSAYRMVVLPDALRVSWPAITTRLVHNLKNTALASFVAVPELFQSLQGAISETFRATELLTLTAVVYLALTAGFTALLRVVDGRLHRGRSHARRV